MESLSPSHYGQGEDIVAMEDFLQSQSILMTTASLTSAILRMEMGTESEVVGVNDYEQVPQSTTRATAPTLPYHYHEQQYHQQQQQQQQYPDDNRVSHYHHYNYSNNSNIWRQVHHSQDQYSHSHSHSHSIAYHVSHPHVPQQLQDSRLQVFPSQYPSPLYMSHPYPHTLPPQQHPHTHITSSPHMMNLHDFTANNNTYQQHQQQPLSLPQPLPAEHIIHHGSKRKLLHDTLIPIPVHTFNHTTPHITHTLPTLFEYHPQQYQYQYHQESAQQDCRDDEDEDDDTNSTVSSLSDSNFGSDYDYDNGCDDALQEGKGEVSENHNNTLLSSLPLHHPLSSTMTKHSFYHKFNHSYYHFINGHDSQSMRHIIYEQHCLSLDDDICSISRHWSKDNPHKDAKMNPFGTVNYKEFYGIDDVVNYFSVMFESMPDLMAHVTQTCVMDITERDMTTLSSKGESGRERGISPGEGVVRGERIGKRSKTSSWRGRGGKKVVSRFVLQATAVLSVPVSPPSPSPLSPDLSTTATLASSSASPPVSPVSPSSVVLEEAKVNVFQSNAFSKAYEFKHPMSKALNSIASSEKHNASSSSVGADSIPDPPADSSPCLTTSASTSTTTLSTSSVCSSIAPTTPSSTTTKIVRIPGKIEGYLISFFDVNDKVFHIEMHYFSLPPTPTISSSTSIH